MKRAALIVLAGLAACSDREVGQSVYFEGPYASVERQTPIAAENPEVAAMRAQIAERRAALAAEQAARARQEALVASIESAIDDADRRTALRDGAMPSALPPLEETVVVAETPRPVAPVPVPVPVPTPGGDGTITDNSFSTITARETIESDAERLARLQRGTVVLEAEPLPERENDVNLVAFARGTTHKVGQKIYRRSGGRDGSAARTCRRYGNPDEAQRAFLAQGGPTKDRLGIDPDGDGFVCGWTPDPYRALRVTN